MTEGDECDVMQTYSRESMLNMKLQLWFLKELQGGTVSREDL